MPTPARQHHWITLALLTTAGISFAVMQTLVIPALPFFQREFGATQADTTWIVTGFFLSTSVLTPLLSKLGDMHGKKRMLVIALSVFAVGSLGAAASDSLNGRRRVPRAAGRRRGGLPAELRHHPRRVPAREGRAGGRRPLVRVRRRRRDRAGLERVHPGGAQLALAVPARRGAGGGRRRARHQGRARVARPARRTA